MSILKNLCIIGAGGFGREVSALVSDINKTDATWNFLGFIDDNESGLTVEGEQILGTVDDLVKMNPKPYVAIAIASYSIREKISKICEKNNIPVATLIHPSCEIGPKCEIGEGSIVCKKSQFTTNIKVGRFCILNENCALGHDTVLDDYVSVMSQGLFGGESFIGKGCYFGLRSTVINRISIVPECIFGAGCVVVKNIEEKGTYVGVPARKVK